jgi:hypothetical protein
LRSPTLVDLLRFGRTAFGVFAPERTGTGGALAGADPEIDFVFYDLETAPWDMAALRAFGRAMEETAGQRGPCAILLRIPPVHVDGEAARRHVAEGLAAGAAGIILPQVEEGAKSPSRRTSWARGSGPGIRTATFSSWSRSKAERR